MIDIVLNSMGKKRCDECRKLVDEDAYRCSKCGYSFAKTSTPEEGLTDNK